MQVKNRFQIALFALFVVMLSMGGSEGNCFAQVVAPSGGALSIPESDRVQPAAVAKLLQSPESEKPLLIHVGFRVMYGQAHIQGSIYAGPGSQAAGLKDLETRVGSMAKGRLIIIYCGCCPWTKCPNMGPAYKRLRELGFTNVKAVYMVNSFGDDWVAKGFPVAQGQ